MPTVSHEYFNNTKAAKELALTYRDMDGQEMEVKTLPAKNIFVSISIMADKNISLSNSNISPFDMAVMDSIYTLLLNESSQFTPETVARTMSGNFYQKITPQKSEAITRSIEKLRHITIKIDITDEMRARKKIKTNEHIMLGSYLLPVEDAELITKNRTVRCYRLIEKPALYDYAERNSQIISVPVKLLTDKSTSSDTEEEILIKRYLIKRIETMKNKKNKIKKRDISYIWLDTDINEYRGMLLEIGIEHPENISRNKRSDIHKTAIQILNQFIESKYIKGYKVNTTKVRGGSRNDGFHILLNEDTDEPENRASEQ